MNMTATTSTKADNYRVINDCPKCKGALLPTGDVLKCFTCERVYRIEKGQYKETFEVTSIKKWR